MVKNITERPTLEVQHRTRLEQIRREAIDMAGTLVKISQALDQVLEQGGTANIQPQFNFVTGAYARMAKDWGVAEHLQTLGATQRKRPPVR